MDVSNSTGESTGYRVVGSGGAQPDPAPPEEAKSGKGRKGKPAPPLSPFFKTLAEGRLEPNRYVTLDVSHDRDVEVHFFNEKGPLAKQVIPAGQCKNVLVSLVSNGRGLPKAYLCHRAA